MSNNLNTKDIKTGGGGVPKLLQPGNTICKIMGVTLEQFKFKEGGYHVVLHLEGPDLGADFEGFFLNKDDESLGRHKGQVGQVKAAEWAYADGETKTGIVITRDAEILKVIKNICTTFGCLPWLDAQDNKHATIESLVNALNTEQPFGKNTAEFCIAGKEYLNKGGYINYELFLPKYSKAGAPFGKIRVLTFDPEEHIRKKKVETMLEFGSEVNTPLNVDTNTPLSEGPAGDFQI